MKFTVGLSTRPEKYIGEITVWDKAENILKSIITKFDEHHINEGDGAFYGPKLDFTVTDSIGRKHQLATIQLDFNLPERFDLQFKSEDSYERPIMIHRAILGSIERFIAILLESKQGNLPLFVSPRQVAILTINDSEDLVNYAKKIKKDFENNGLKEVHYIDDKESIPKKVLNCEVLHYNYIIVLGKKELANNSINVRGIGEIKLDDFIKNLKF
jgi:threonyl-tRNA synthetase